MQHQVHTERRGEQLHLRIRGDLELPGVQSLSSELLRAAADNDVLGVVVDLSETGRLDSRALAALSVGERDLANRGKALRVQGLNPVHRRAFSTLAPPPFDDDAHAQVPATTPSPPRRASGRGVVALAWLVTTTFEELVVFLLRPRKRSSAGSFVSQTATLGVDGWPLVLSLSVLIALIVGLQSAITLQPFGAEEFVVDAIMVGMVREFAPIMTAIIVAGRSGTAIAAELGTMAVSEELDALRSMGIAPVRYLVVPRVLAMSTALPALTLLAFAGTLLGGIGTAAVIGMSPVFFVDRTVAVLELRDVGLGLVKSVLFAWIVAFTACSSGLATRGGASGVGRSATRAVVWSILFIVLTDSLTTLAWTMGRDV